MATVREADIETRPCRYGLLSFFKNDTIVSRSLLEYGEWAQGEVEFLLGLIAPGDAVLDVGAFIGTHTLAFAKRVGSGGEVYAFEPHPLFFEVLKKNIGQNVLTNVKLLNVGLSDEVHQAHIHGIDVRASSNFAGTPVLETGPHTGELIGSHTITLTTLDQLAIERCSLIKIDAENMEVNVLKGSRRTLRAARPVVFAECNSLHCGWPVVEFMTQEEYRIYLLNVPAYNPQNFRRNANNFFGDGREAGLVLIPEERHSELEDNLNQLRRRQSLIPISCLDDLALGLLKKPQYKYEVMLKGEAADVLGVGFWANQSEVEQIRGEFGALQAEVERLRARVSVLDELTAQVSSVTSDRDRLVQEVAQLHADMSRVTSDRDRLVQEVAQLHADMSRVTSDRDRLVQEVAQLHATIHAQHAALTQSDADMSRVTSDRDRLAEEVARLHATIHAQHAALTQSDAEVRRLDGELNRIYDSHGWKVLSAYYGLRNKLLPEGSRRRDFSKRMLRVILSSGREIPQQAQPTPISGATSAPSEEEASGKVDHLRQVTINAQSVSSQDTRLPASEPPATSVIGHEAKWEEYETLSQRIAGLKQARLEKIAFKSPVMVSIAEDELVTHAASLQFPAAEHVTVSIVIRVANDLKRALECLTSLHEIFRGRPLRNCCSR